MAVGAALTLLPQARLAAWLAAATALAAAAVAMTYVLSGAGEADPLGAGAFVLVAVLAATGAVAAIAVFAREFEPRVQSVAHGLSLIALGACLAAVTADDAVRLALALTGAGIACAALSGLAAVRDRAGAPVALGATLAALSAGALAVFGASLLVTATGVADLADIAATLHRAGAEHGLPGVALLLTACALFAGVAPMHGWAADQVGHAPHGAAVVIAVVARVAAFAALIRVYGLAQADSFSGVTTGLDYACAALGAVGVIVGSAQAIGARDARRLAAHALTAQFGCALIALAAGGVDGAIAALFVVAAGAMTTLALVVGAAAARPLLGASAPMAALDGLAKTRPFVAAAVGVASFGLTGAPLTAAFLGKWLSVEAALSRGWYWAAAAIVAASFAAVFVAGQIIERMYFRTRSAQIGPAPAGALAFAPALALAAATTLAFGWNGTAPLEAARLAARALTGAP